MGGAGSKSKTNVEQIVSATTSHLTKPTQEPDTRIQVETLEILRKSFKHLPTPRGGEVKTISLIALAQEAEANCYEEGDTVLRKGDIGSGIHIVLKGAAVVTSGDGHDVFANISEGDIFGEISVFYNLPVTANVVAKCSLKTLFFPKDVVNEILGDVSIDVLDWHVERKYIPMSDNVDSGKVWRRTALHTLKKLAIFQTWSDDYLKKLILSLHDEVVILYESGSYILSEGDVSQSIYIIIRGSVEMKCSEQAVTLDCREYGPLVVGEEVLFGGAPSRLSVKAGSCCLIIRLERKNIQYITDMDGMHLVLQTQFSDWERKFSIDSSSLNTERPLYFPFEFILVWFLKNPVFKDCRQRFIYSLIFDGEIVERRLGESLYDRDDEGSLILFLKGRGELRDMTADNKTDEYCKYISAGYIISTLLYSSEFPGNKENRVLFDAVYDVIISSKRFQQTMEPIGTIDGTEGCGKS